MKFLCICKEGNVRSVAITYPLKRFGQEAIAAGWNSASADTLKMLCEWADAIIFMQLEYIQRLEEKMPMGFDHKKIVVVDVGPDTYGTPIHDGLREYVTTIVKDWKKKNFELVSALGNQLPLR
jgi:predicted protein tyrosine phosphatase